jgi:hypothetical protein
MLGLALTLIESSGTEYPSIVKPSCQAPVSRSDQTGYTPWGSDQFDWDLTLEHDYLFNV